MWESSWTYMSGISPRLWGAELQAFSKIVKPEDFKSGGVLCLKKNNL